MARTGDAQLESLLDCGDISKSTSMCNSKDKHSRAPLHLAAFSGQVEAINTLLKFKADVDALAMDGYTALHFACQNNHLECVKKLLDAKANIDRCLFKSKKSPLHIACSKENEDVFTLLINKGADTGLKTRQDQLPADLIASPELKEKFNTLVDSKLKGKRALVDLQELQAKDKQVKVVSDTTDSLN